MATKGYKFKVRLWLSTFNYIYVTMFLINNEEVKQMKYYIKITTIVCVLLFSMCMTGCEDENENRKEIEQKKELSFKECFELMEKNVKSGNYKVNIILYETEYRASVEDNLGWFEVSNDEDASYIGWNDYVAQEDGSVNDDEVYDILYYANNTKGVSETFVKDKDRAVKYSYVENPKHTVVEDFFANMAEHDISGMIKGSFGNSMPVMILPKYQELLSCVDKVVQNEEKAFVKSIIKNDKESVLFVSLKDFLKWCDDEESEYNISTEMSQRIDGYADDTVLEINFKTDDGNVKMFSMMLTSENSSMDVGFCWELSQIDKSSKAEYETLIECIKPGNKDVAFKLFIQDNDTYVSKEFDDKIYYGKGISVNEGISGDFIKALHVVTECVTSFVFRYNGYDYDFEIYEFPEEQESLWTWDYSEFYTGEVWAKILDGENIGEEEKIDDWKAKMLSVLLEEETLDDYANVAYLNDDDIPEIVTYADKIYSGDVYIYSYVEGDIITYGPFDHGSSELYIQDRKMKIGCFDEYDKYNDDAWDWYDSKEYHLFDLDKCDNYEMFELDLNMVDHGDGPEYFVNNYYMGYIDDVECILSDKETITEAEYKQYESEIESNYKKLSLTENVVWRIVYEMLEDESALLSKGQNMSETDKDRVNEEETTEKKTNEEKIEEEKINEEEVCGDETEKEEITSDSVKHQETRVIDFADALGKNITFLESKLSGEPYKLECIDNGEYSFGGITIEIDNERIRSILVEYEKFPVEYREIFTFSPGVNGKTTQEYVKANWGEFLSSGEQWDGNVAIFRRWDEVEERLYFLDITYSDIGKIISIKYSISGVL